MILISIHALCEEGDTGLAVLHGGEAVFLSTPSARRATPWTGDKARPFKFLSTPSARRATLRQVPLGQGLRISIHALCEEGDASHCRRAARSPYFYPRPLRGGRHDAARGQAVYQEFLSTPSARRATQKSGPRPPQREDFYPRPLRGGRPLSTSVQVTGSGISIHALCEEGDRASAYGTGLSYNFYPRPLRGGRRIQSFSSAGPANFYPRPLRGGRPTTGWPLRYRTVFLSTPSARRATVFLRRCSMALFISIHALCEEGDAFNCALPALVKIFLSTPSARRATLAFSLLPRSHDISIHALCEEGDPRCRPRLPIHTQFLSIPTKSRICGIYRKLITKP